MTRTLSAFLMNHIVGLNPLSQHFATISVSDLILVNEEGQVVIGEEPINAAAFAIHSEVRSMCGKYGIERWF